MWQLFKATRQGEVTWGKNANEKRRTWSMGSRTHRGRRDVKNQQKETEKGEFVM